MFHSRHELVTTKEVAELLGVTTAAIYKWVKEGSMPKPFRLGGPRAILRWKRTEIMEWLEESKDD